LLDLPPWVWLRKSKPDSIKVGGKVKAAAAVFAGLSLAGAAPSEAAKVPPPKLVRISTDTTATPGAQHATEVEPDAVAVGSRIVATFQVGRYFGGGAGAIGFATSTDAGRSWRSGILPAVTGASSPPGPAAGASDPVVAYDAQHAAGSSRRCPASRARPSSSSAARRTASRGTRRRS
jgi:hypothetical protein